ncbi:hypothetical protein DLAC_06752 [Tieghemostelium lacteum]|uniref:Transmembrane protein n=1 Tax=Tieghemostelium lacteum TaxID=361077 RepID=A0A151ZFL0_TIELA|nr:hypothetical protein DLAC_06752 [Tieghemostelium lacteum]|eukprot:KYQ92748.1 hypothetical protein DLAC_06752 [Tieghemostelium lacteum]
MFKSIVIILLIFFISIESKSILIKYFSDDHCKGGSEVSYSIQDQCSENSIIQLNTTYFSIYEFKGNCEITTTSKLLYSGLLHSCMKRVGEGSWIVKVLPDGDIQNILPLDKDEFPLSSCGQLSFLNDSNGYCNSKFYGHFPNDRECVVIDQVTGTYGFHVCDEFQFTKYSCGNDPICVPTSCNSTTVSVNHQCLQPQKDKSLKYFSFIIADQSVETNPPSTPQVSKVIKNMDQSSTSSGSLLKIPITLIIILLIFGMRSN